MVIEEDGVFQVVLIIQDGVQQVSLFLEDFQVLGSVISMVIQYSSIIFIIFSYDVDLVIFGIYIVIMVSVDGSQMQFVIIIIFGVVVVEDLSVVFFCY